MHLDISVGIFICVMEDHRIGLGLPKLRNEIQYIANDEHISILFHDGLLIDIPSYMHYDIVLKRGIDWNECWMCIL